MEQCEGLSMQEGNQLGNIFEVFSTNDEKQRIQKIYYINSLLGNTAEQHPHEDLIMRTLLAAMQSNRVAWFGHCANLELAGIRLRNFSLGEDREGLKSIFLTYEDIHKKNDQDETPKC